MFLSTSHRVPPRQAQLSPPPFTSASRTISFPFTPFTDLQPSGQSSQNMTKDPKLQLRILTFTFTDLGESMTEEPSYCGRDPVLTGEVNSPPLILGCPMPILSDHKMKKISHHVYKHNLQIFYPVKPSVFNRKGWLLIASLAYRTQLLINLLRSDQPRTSSSPGTGIIRHFAP